MPRSHFCDLGIDVQDGDQAGGAGGERGVRRHPADAFPVHGRQGRAGVEPVPAEPQDDATEGTEGQVVGRHWAAAVALELPSEAGPQDDAAGEGDDAADGVHDGRPGEVSEDDPAGVVHEVAEPAHRVAQPASRAPHPVTEDRVDQAGHEDAVEDVALEAGATNECARRDRRGRISERELEEEEGEERHRRRLVGRSGGMEEEVLVPDAAVARPELEREADRPVQDAAHARVEHARQQHVHRFSRAGEPRFEGHEAGLHEEDEERGDEDPHRVDRTDDVVRLNGHLVHRRGTGGGFEEEREALHDGQERRDPEHLPAQDHHELLADVRVFEPSQRELPHSRETRQPMCRPMCARRYESSTSSFTRSVTVVTAPSLSHGVRSPTPEPIHRLRATRADRRK